RGGAPGPGWSRSGVLDGEAIEGVAREVVGQPVLELDEPEAAIEVARRVPVQHRKAHARAAALARDPGETRHEHASDAEPARALGDEQILDVEARTTVEGRVARAMNREAHRLAIDLGQQARE